MASWLMSEGDNGCLLMIDLDENTGGAVAYRESQIRYLQAEGWRIILLRYGRDDGNWFLSIRYLPEERPVRLDSLQDIEHLLDVISVKRVFVNNLAFYANIDEALEFLRRMKRKHPFQLHYVFHDFLSLCPSFFLLDKNNRYCQSGTPERCLSCAHGNLNRVVAFEDLPRWRSWWADFFDVCDSMTCFSQTTKDIVERVYSLGDRLTVQEHMPLAVFTEKFTPPTAPESMELAFVGNFVPQKGSDTIYELAELFIAKGIKARIHIFGLSGVNTPHPRIVRHGPTFVRICQYCSGSKALWRCFSHLSGLKRSAMSCRNVWAWRFHSSVLTSARQRSASANMPIRTQYLPEKFRDRGSLMRL